MDLGLLLQPHHPPFIAHIGHVDPPLLRMRRVLALLLLDLDLEERLAGFIVNLRIFILMKYKNISKRNNLVSK
jgi:hypothetical protein